MPCVLEGDERISFTAVGVRSPLVGVFFSSDWAIRWLGAIECRGGAPDVSIGDGFDDSDPVFVALASMIVDRRWPSPPRIPLEKLRLGLVLEEEGEATVVLILFGPSRVANEMAPSGANPPPRIVLISWLDGVGIPPAFLYKALAPSRGVTVPTLP